MRIPSGLKNAVAYCRNITKDLLDDLDDVLVYIDDILICSTDKTKHDKTVEDIMNQENARHMQKHV